MCQMAQLQIAQCLLPRAPVAMCLMPSASAFCAKCPVTQCQEFNVAFFLFFLQELISPKGFQLNLTNLLPPSYQQTCFWLIGCLDSIYKYNPKHNISVSLSTLVPISFL